MKIRIRNYQIEVYIADRIRHDEERTYAWEIVHKDRPYRILYASRLDYPLTNSGLEAALQDAINTFQRVEEAIDYELLYSHV